MNLPRRSVVGRGDTVGCVPGLKPKASRLRYPLDLQHSYIKKSEIDVISGLMERLIEFDCFFKEVEMGGQVPRETSMGERTGVS